MHVFLACMFLFFFSTQKKCFSFFKISCMFLLRKRERPCNKSTRFPNLSYYARLFVWSLDTHATNKGTHAEMPAISMKHYLFVFIHPNPVLDTLPMKPHRQRGPNKALVLVPHFIVPNIGSLTPLCLILDQGKKDMVCLIVTVLALSASLGACMDYCSLFVAYCLCTHTDQPINTVISLLQSHFL